MAVNNCYIELIGFGRLNLSSNFPVPITKSVAEIQDITAKNASFSKTIVVPGTKNNNTLLGNLFDINAVESTFNINRKVNCVIYSDDLPVLKGYFRLTNIKKISPSSPTDDDYIEYESLVFDQTTNFYDKLGDNLLENLDLSQYDHILNFENVIGATSVSATTVYPMYNNANTNSYSTLDFWPAVRLKTYIDSIFDEYGYSYESDFFENNPDFTNLIIPYNGERPTNSLNVINQRKFRAQIVSGTNISVTASTIGSSGIPTLPLVPFNNDSATGNFDSGNTYDTTTYTYTSPANQKCTFNIKIPYRIKLSSPSGCTFTPSGFGSSTIQFRLKAGVKKNGVTFAAYAPENGIGISAPLSIGPGVTYLTPTQYLTASAVFDDSNSFSSLKVNDTVSVFPIAQMLNTSNSTFKSGSTDVLVDIVIEYDSAGSTYLDNYFYNEPATSTPSEGDTIFLNDYIPKQVKQKDVFSSVVKMFNLFIETDDDNENKLIIKTRNEYYSGSTFVDWTKKLAIDSEHSFKFLPELQNRDFLLTYKKGTDDLSKLYFESVNETYGQQKFTFDNDFIKGERKLELAFETCPLTQNGIVDVSTGQGMIVPNINSAAPKTGLKVLYYGGWIPGNTWIFNYRTTVGAFSAQSFTTYPYAGHFDNPIYPSKDFNFGECQQLFYSNYGAITDNTLSNRYYFDYLQQIIDGKLFTGMFDLNPVDINNIRFNDKVFIKDSYYYINKIIDFDANSNGLTKVELIKTSDGIDKFLTTNRYNPILIAGRPIGNIGVVLPSTGPEIFGNVKPPFRPIIGSTFGYTTNANVPINTFVGGNNNTFGGGVGPGGTQGDGGIVIGDSNVIGGKSRTVTFGSGNTIGGNNKTFIAGNDNFVDGNNMLVLGNSNTATTENILIIGDGISGDTPNSLYVHNIFLVPTGGTINGLSFSSLTADTRVTGYTYDNINTFTIADSSGDTFSATITNLSGLSISATTFYSGSTPLSQIFSGGTSASLWAASTGTNSIIANNGSGNIAGDFAIAAGKSNISSFRYSNIGGGINNTASASYSTVGGGQLNWSSTNWAVVGGGQSNWSVNNWSFIGGGINNTAYASSSTIGGGRKNTTIISGAYSTIAGGRYNLVSGAHSFVGGGLSNSATGIRSSVVGGSGNIASGAYSFIGGGGTNNVSGVNSAILNGSANTLTATRSAIIGGTNITGTTNDTVYVPNLNINTLPSTNNALTNLLVRDSNGTVLVRDVSSISGGGGGFSGWTASTGIHSIVANNGTNNYSSSAFSIVGGSGNSVSATLSFIGNGNQNTISSVHSFIGAGKDGNITGKYSSVVGGYHNKNYADYSFIGGGIRNTGGTTSQMSFLGAGLYNMVSGYTSFVGSGRENTVHASQSAIVAGGKGKAYGPRNFIGTGNRNTTSNYYSVILGGFVNVASGKYSAIVNGSGQTASGYYSFIGGGIGNIASAPRTVIGGGRRNTANFESSTISGGDRNTASGYDSFIGGGKYNVVGQGGVVAGGQSNTAGSLASVVGGLYNNASADGSFVGGGSNNTAAAWNSAVLNGYNNKVTGLRSAIIGGQNFTGTSNDTVYIPNGRAVSSFSAATFYSGSTELSLLFGSGGGGDITRVQNGLNTYTGGTANNPTVNVSGLTINNITVSGSSSFASISATTIYSGSTDLSSLFSPVGGTGVIGITIDGGGSVPTTGSKGFAFIPYNGTITEWHILSDVSGSTVVDVKRLGASIVGGGGNKPTLSSMQQNVEAVSGWDSNTVSYGDYIEFNLDSVTTCTRINLFLVVNKS